VPPNNRPNQVRVYNRYYYGGYPGFYGGFGFYYPGFGPRWYGYGGGYGDYGYSGYSPGYGVSYAASQPLEYQPAPDANVMPSADEMLPEEGRTGDAAEPEDANVAIIDLLVPAQAEVWFDGQKTTQTGKVREFITPSLNPDKSYRYDIKVRWTTDGKEVIRKREVEVHAGDHLGVNFLPAAERKMPRTRPATP
jgi:uncharacterized protein (TIGR03000 family)